MAGPSFVCELLNADHRLDHFSCGNPAYDDWLRNDAFPAQLSRLSRVFVLVRPEDPKRVLAYFTLTNITVFKKDVPARFAKGTSGASQMPAILLGRLARDLSTRGLLPTILASAFQRAVWAADISAARLLTLDAADEGLANIYERYGFQRAKVKPERSTIPMVHFIQDIDASIQAAAAADTADVRP